MNHDDHEGREDHEPLKRFSFFVTLVILVIFVVAVGISAQTQVFRARVDTVLVTVTVTDANGRLIPHLTKSDFEIYVGTLESYIYPALLGVHNDSDLDKLDEILFIDTQTGNLLHKVTPRDEKV